MFRIDEQPALGLAPRRVRAIDPARRASVEAISVGRAGGERLYLLTYGDERLPFRVRREASIDPLGGPQIVTHRIDLVGEVEDVAWRHRARRVPRDADDLRLRAVIAAEGLVALRTLVRRSPRLPLLHRVVLDGDVFQWPIYEEPAAA